MKGQLSTKTEETILGIVREVLGRSGVGLDDDLFANGATSLSFVRVLAQINQQLGVAVHAADLKTVSAQGLADYVSEKIGA